MVRKKISKFLRLPSSGHNVTQPDPQISQQIMSNLGQDSYIENAMATLQEYNRLKYIVNSPHFLPLDSYGTGLDGCHRLGECNEHINDIYKLFNTLINNKQYQDLSRPPTLTQLEDDLGLTDLYDTIIRKLKEECIKPNPESGESNENKGNNTKNLVAYDTIKDNLIKKIPICCDLYLKLIQRSNMDTNRDVITQLTNTQDQLIKLQFKLNNPKFQVKSGVTRQDLQSEILDLSESISGYFLLHHDQLINQSLQIQQKLNDVTHQISEITDKMDLSQPWKWRDAMEKSSRWKKGINNRNHEIKTAPNTSKTVGDVIKSKTAEREENGYLSHLDHHGAMPGPITSINHPKWQGKFTVPTLQTYQDISGDDMSDDRTARTYTDLLTGKNYPEIRLQVIREDLHLRYIPSKNLADQKLYTELGKINYIYEFAQNLKKIGINIRIMWKDRFKQLISLIQKDFGLENEKQALLAFMYMTGIPHDVGLADDNDASNNLCLLRSYHRDYYSSSYGIFTHCLFLIELG